MSFPDFDLDASVQDAWDQFEARLSDVVASIDESDDLIIDADDRCQNAACGRLTFHSGKADEVTVRAAGNAQLAAAERLGERERDALVAAGWREDDGGDFVLTGTQDDADRLAHACVVALREGYGVQHPAFLVPDQLADVLIANGAADAPPAALPELMVRSPRTQAELEALIATELRSYLGHEPIRDEQGDFALRHGSVMVFVRATPDADEVIVFSVVVHDVEGRSRAMEVLNDYNVVSRFVRFELIRDQVFVQMSVLARPFVPQHLQQAVRLVAELADGIDEALAQHLRGRTTFPDDHE